MGITDRNLRALAASMRRPITCRLCGRVLAGPGRYNLHLRKDHGVDASTAQAWALNDSSA